MKKILVIMPLYNREKLVSDAIESVLQQTYKNIELIIIDDKSTDDSLRIAKEYSDKYDNVTVLENTENKGCYYSRNRGLEYFKDKEWDLFTIHDPDDISDITRFEKLVSRFDDPELVCLKTTYIKMDLTTGEYVKTPSGANDIYCSEGIAMYSRKAFELNGYFDNTRHSGDTEYVTRLRAQAYVTKKNMVQNDDRILYICQIDGNNLTKIHPVSERGDYYKKINADITKRLKTLEFYRPFFS